jgi:hypothetical protein
MANSKANMLKKLYLKDLREARTEIFIVAAVTLTLITWVYLKTEGPGRSMILIPIMLALGLAGFLPIITSFRLVGREWGFNTIYMLMSLPVSGTIMLGSKLLVLITEYIVCTIMVGIIGGTAVIISFPEVWEYLLTDSYFIKVVLLAYVTTISGIIFVFCNSIFSQVTGKLFSKYSGLITFIVFILVFVAAGKITPDVNIMLVNGNWLTDSEIREITIFLLVDLIISAILFAGAVLLWEKRIEI